MTLCVNFSAKYESDIYLKDIFKKLVSLPTQKATIGFCSNKKEENCQFKNPLLCAKMHRLTEINLRLFFIEKIFLNCNLCSSIMLWHCKSTSIDKQITQNYIILEKSFFGLI